MLTAIMGEMPLNKAYARLKVWPYLGTKHRSKQLMTETETQNRLICSNRPFDKTLLLHEKRVLLLLINIGSPSQENDPPIVVEVRDPILPLVDDITAIPVLTLPLE